MTLRSRACTLEYLANQLVVLVFRHYGTPLSLQPLKSPVTSNNRLENCTVLYKGLHHTLSKVYVPSAADAK
jgi:hypothetical protein